MRGGHVDAVSRTQVSGWAADSDHPDVPLEIRVLVNAVEVGRTIADKPRQDVAALGRFGAGGHGFAFAFADPLAADHDQAVSVRYADTMRVLPNGDRVVPRDDAAPVPPAPVSAPAIHAPAPAQTATAQIPPTGPAPILVTAPGRSGTTYLMSRLAVSPQIVVAELVPYEVRLLSYYAAAFDVLTAPADTARSTHPDRLEGDGFHIGFNPFNAPQYAHAFRGKAALAYFQDDWVPSRLGAALADLVREYYRRMAVDRGRGAVTLFAEKNNNLHPSTRMFVRRAFPAKREIAIVRDPRDVLCSHVAYFSSSQEKAFNQLNHSCNQLAALHETADDDLCFIRYEDMVRGDAATFARLSAFLDAEVTAQGDAAEGAMFRNHGTSETPESSIGRWRHDLPADLRLQSSRVWGPFLERFGYQTS